METRVATAMSTGSVKEATTKICKQLREKMAGQEPNLVMVFASTTQPLDQVAPVFQKEFSKATVVGASTAGEFVESGDQKGSVSAFALSGDFHIVSGMGKGLKNDVEKAVQNALSKFPQEMDGYPHRAAILLLDPLAGNGEEATMLAAGMLGDVPLAGGAAGDDLHMKATQVCHGGTACSDAIVAVEIFSKKPLGLGVCHGHKPVSKPMKVTRATGNIVHEVDGKPAWNAWAEATRASAKKRNVDPDKLKDNDVGGYLLRYEAGLQNGTAFKIRAPLSRNADGSLSFACGIPQGSTIQITESVPQDQVESAREAARQAKMHLKGSVPVGAVVFDCICRNLILDDQFRTAVRGISEELGGVPLAGFETYGEIAMTESDLSGFHNTTTVVLTFSR